jgi:hypothetical protein
VIAMSLGRAVLAGATLIVLLAAGCKHSSDDHSTSTPTAPLPSVTHATSTTQPANGDTGTLS